ncbi:FUSC family protein [Streptomyces sp. J2-1]|uniref:FUSC family protein n=1 Tax=Streptomyces corallincola TaxID=2851888 RepID=UPI001C3895C7|nr:FUSC family protein [Streptomyces corallincola]MBV2356016.1 FUSC family protein [Streptomyces corallincola]
MSRGRSLGLMPPDWLARNLRPGRARSSRPAMMRSAVAMSVPLAAGFALGMPGYGALASIGAVYGVLCDTADAYRLRVITIAVPQFVGAIGIVIGSLVRDQGWTAVAVITGVALVSGMISTVGAVSSVSALLLLLNTIIAAGLPLPGPWWAAPALITGGGLLVLALALLAWPLRAGVPERSSVAAAYRTAAALLAACGDAARYETARLDVTEALNHAYDAVLTHRARHHGRSNELTRLLARLNALTPILEAAPAVHLAGRPLPPEAAETLRRLADAFAAGGPSGPPPVLPVLPPPATETERAVDRALRYAAEVVAAPDADPSGVEDRLLGSPVPPGPRTARAVRGAVLSAHSWRYGLRLALSIGIAQALVSVVPLPRSYWVALTVTFVLKPDFGSVFSRALLRALGTVAGVVISAAVLAAVPPGWWTVLVVFALALLIPVLTPRGYAYQTAVITPIILVLSDILNHQGFSLLVPRLVDSLIGCVVVLIVGYLLWPESWRTRVGDRLAGAVSDTAAYVDSAFRPGTDPAARARMRRRLYRDLSTVRAEFQRALTEPTTVGRRAAAWWPLVVAVERIVDATTAARVHVRDGAPPPDPAEIRQVSLQLRELADSVRRTDTPAPVRTHLTGPPDSVLEPVRQEVAAARAITGPADRPLVQGR